MKNYLMQMRQCISAKDFCSWIEAYQRTVWHRIGYSRSIRGMKVYEVVITQNLVFDLALKRFPNVKILESRDERKNGSDLLIEIKCGGKIKKLAVQAKIVYSNETFPRIDHMVKGSRQIDLLLNYARNNGYQPAYMFYGYRKSSLLHDYGISISNAHHIEKKYFSSGAKTVIPKMTDLLTNPKCVPVSNEFCCQSNGSILKFEDGIVFTENSIDWRKIDDEVQSHSRNWDEGNEFDGFNPAYLIQVSGD